MRIGLTLSGGGFRALLFHLGVIRRLRAEGVLAQLGYIASVSGGSIMAAHLLTNWEKYNSSPEDFDSAAGELISLTKIDVRGRIQRRLPFLWLLAVVPFIPNRLRITPTHLLAKYYDRYLFRGGSAADVEGLTRPTLLILSTNLSRPGLTCFSHKSALHIPINGRAVEPIKVDIIPLAQVVAASSAYPGFFPPISLSDSEIIVADEGSFERQYFTDAGIFDNLGLYGLRKAVSGSLDRVLASEAGRSFVPRKEYEFGILRTALRAVDILMFRIRQLDLASTGGPVTLMSISDETDAPGASSSAVQAQLESIRTDFDKFSELEITELMRHGYYVAATALASEQGVSVLAEKPEWDIPQGSWVKTPAQRNLTAKLKLSSRRRWRIFSARDWISWVQLATVMSLIVALVLVSSRIAEGIDSVIAGIRAYPLTRYNPPQWTEPPPQAIETVQDLTRPRNEGFEIVSDNRVWDLRQLQSKPLSGGVMEVTGPVLMTRVSSLIKRQPTANQYKYLYQTAAREFSAWSPKENVGVKLLRSEQRTVNGNDLVTSYELQLDVSNIGMNEEFVLEAQAKTIDAPWDRNHSWLGMSITDPTPAASMRIIFPKRLPYKSAHFLKYPNDTPLEAQSFDGIKLESTAEKELLWRVDRPQIGWTYKVQWDWE